MGRRQNSPESGRGERIEYGAMISEHTVAPAVHPVSTERDWVILDSPVMLIYVLPQKSLAALGD
jgi:hypothetical protein